MGEDRGDVRLRVEGAKAVLLDARGRMEERLETGGRLLVVFDGHCGLCNDTVRWLLRHDRGDRLRFVSLESEKVAGVRARHSLSGLDAATGTLLAVREGGGAAESVLLRSDAVAALLGELPWPWPWVGAMLGLVPRAVRDGGYRLVARWRYRIWGRVEQCPMPTEAERARFL